VMALMCATIPLTIVGLVLFLVRDESPSRTGTTTGRRTTGRGGAVGGSRERARCASVTVCVRTVHRLGISDVRQVDDRQRQLAGPGVRVADDRRAAQDHHELRAADL